MRLVRGQELSARLGGGLRLHDGILVLIEGPDRFLVYLCVRKRIEWKKYVSVFLRREKGERNFASSRTVVAPVVAFKVPLRSI